MLRAMMSIILLATCGCAATPPIHDAADVIFIVPGVNGEIGGMMAGLSQGPRSVQSVSWGMPPPLFFMNFSDKPIHDAAEKKLAQTIAQWRQMHPDGQIDLVGHSAGCGVILGALPLIGEVRVGDVVLLAPSVSPTYDLHPALEKIAGQLHVFYSQHDTVFLQWRDSHFGTYDRIKTSAAGFAGFAGMYLSDKVVQHQYQDQWRDLGNDGGHFGTISEPFVREILAPLLAK
jgi:pimeloyl-ACP methyl ester carboxylesterase